MIKVKVKNGNRFFEKAMKKFSRKMDKEGTMKEVRERMHFVKPSVKKREKNKAAARRNYLQTITDKRDNYGGK